MFILACYYFLPAGKEQLIRIKTMSPNPKASIIITSYNQRPTLELLLATLERQTIQDFEVIIADDGSSDGTDQLCSRQDQLALRFETQPDIGDRKAKTPKQKHPPT